MKKTFLMLALAGGILAAHAQSDKKEEPKQEKKEMAMKKHVCTDECHKSGKHVYAHGEKGHVCTDACKKK
ncbi:MAG: hypothetical protein JST76_01020 [Bacteroidetes bacterium]|nr:hypothetical protein [Bacteroidota bacterium]MBS1617070.1 hypothetical protein [Bacteroidota bacterium]